VSIPRIMSFVSAQRWAMHPEAHRRMVSLLQAVHESPRGAEDIREHIAAAAKRDAQGGYRDHEMRVDRGVGIVPIRGLIAQRASAVDPLCIDVGTSVEHIRADLQRALANDDVRSILLEVDSPGGSVTGIAGLADDIRAARERKPIVAHTDSMMASAAYWLASQANRVFATRDAKVGSIGVLVSYVDPVRALKDRGFDPVVIKSVPGKSNMASDGQFGEAQQATVQRDVDHLHAMFVDAVAAGRGVARERADAMATGEDFIGGRAVQFGLADGCLTASAALRLTRGLAGRTARSAQ
jgi:capsid assembly protease